MNKPNSTIPDKQHILTFIYENYRHHMFSVALSIVRDPQLAEDVVQETFERIINKFHLIKKIKRNGLHRYTVLITKSIACNLVAKESKVSTIQYEEAEFLMNNDDSFIEDLVIEKESIKIVKDCLEDMGIKYAAPIVLRYYYGFSDKETADMLDINSASTVRSLCFRARKQIEKKLIKLGDYSG